MSANNTSAPPAEIITGGGRSGDGTTLKYVYRKTCALFKCSSCRKTWKSGHAWKWMRYDEFCDFCGNKCFPVAAKDKKTLLDKFECNKCGNHWVAIHAKDNRWDNCNCGEAVEKNPNPTELEGTHYWMMCSDRECRQEWEDFTPNTFTQRCNSCNSRGQVIRIERPIPFRFRRKKVNAAAAGSSVDQPKKSGIQGQDENSNPAPGPSSRMNLTKRGEGDGDGPQVKGHSHSTSYCDMCKFTTSKGRAEGCGGLWKVVIKRNRDDGSEVGVRYCEI